MRAKKGLATERIGAYRFWPYLGYAIGALSSVIIADVYGLQSG